MKNIKNTVAAVGLAAVLGFGSVTANAGMLVSDAPVRDTKGQCTVKNTNFFSDLLGGIMFGLLISDAPTVGCDTNGITMGEGMLMSD